MNRDTETDTTHIVAIDAAAAIATAARIGAQGTEQIAFANHCFPGGVPTPGFNPALTGENA